MFYDVGIAHFLIEVGQQAGNHVAGIGGEAEFFALVPVGQGVDQADIVENIPRDLVLRFTIGSDADPAAAALKKRAAQFLFQGTDYLADIGLCGVKAFGSLVKAAFFAGDHKIFQLT